MNIKKNKSPGLKPKFPKIHIDNSKDVLLAFTDGGCNGNGKEVNRGAYAFCIVEKNKLLYDYSREQNNTTNNKMELEAILNCLTFIEDTIPDTTQVLLHSDSQYAIHGICSWRHGWKKKQWLGVKNVEQWQMISALVDRLPNVQYKWVKAHQEDNSLETRWNKHVDALCTNICGDDQEYKVYTDRKEGAKVTKNTSKAKKTAKQLIPDAKTFLLQEWFKVTPQDERELWYKCSDWASRIVEVMQKYREL